MKIEHISLWAKNIEFLKLFYEKYFNAQSNDMYRNPSKRFSSYFLKFDSGARIESMHMPSVLETTDNPYDQFTGNIHLAFSVGSEDKVDELTAKLEREGFKVLDGIDEPVMGVMRVSF